ncbi:DUF4231 domain-containing protein [Streptomyces sp. NPDC000594]|uniref:DUF4231 domain-containing protein n=1 Tax=Streptomyces sp. NPDC000594 TaxID=3154261 RepID=UPI00331BAADF
MIFGGPMAHGPNTGGSDQSDNISPLSDPADERQEEYRKRLKEFNEIDNDLKTARFLQRLYGLWLTGWVSLALMLWYTVVTGLWNSNETFIKWAGLGIANALWVLGAKMLLAQRKKIVSRGTDLRNALHDRQSAAAQLPLESASGLRIYREASLDLIDTYRRRASRNRRVHNLFQLIIISGSIVTSTLTAMNPGRNDVLAIVTSALSALVGISAGITGYFKFRERGSTSQSTADDIERHYNASQFRLDDYAQDASEADRLRRYAGIVERLKEEQRKRELQLEQSSSHGDERAN